jgi:nitrite reductase (NADH) small subunit
MAEAKTIRSFTQSLIHSFPMISQETSLRWCRAASVDAFPADGGACVLIDGQQIAIFNYTDGATGLPSRWYATQNLCPHKQQMILSRGMIGDCKGEPKVACPFHKKTFSLETGENLNGDDYRIQTYPVRVEEGMVFVGV